MWNESYSRFGWRWVKQKYASSVGSLFRAKIARAKRDEKISLVINVSDLICMLTYY